MDDPGILALRALVRGTYDLQKLRIMAGNRICAQFRSKAGQTPGTKEMDDKEAENLIRALRQSYIRLTDGLVRLPRRTTFVGDELISSYTELVLVHNYVGLLRNEKASFHQFNHVLAGFPIWTEFLVHVRGCGPAMAGVIISEVDVKDSVKTHWRSQTGNIWHFKPKALREAEDTVAELSRKIGSTKQPRKLEQLLAEIAEQRAIVDTFEEIAVAKRRYPSSLWRYAGLDIGPDGRGKSRRTEHLVDQLYVDVNGEEKYKKGLGYNPFLKTKLMGVLADSFIRAGSAYREYYDSYKDRLEGHHVYGSDNDGQSIRGVGHISPARRHIMSKRYMIKMFLKDLYNKWRELEGYHVYPDYQEAKLGHQHGPHATAGGPVNL